MLLTYEAYFMHCRDGTGQDFLDPTGKNQNLRRLTGHWPAGSTFFFTEDLRSVFNKLNDKLYFTLTLSLDVLNTENFI